MRADTQLDYAIFQLTPTRTRCELHVVARGITYKLASGLLKPFVSHLRAAEEQLARGGYSIRLEPPDPSKASWFTKWTMERFVRFVSTPEVLERASCVEVELLELEETARQQSSDGSENNGPGEADNMGTKTASSQIATGKPLQAVVADKVNKEGAETGGVEESSKQRLLRALDARRMMLQKEQGMAFARALAAGFNLENMDDLLLFAECFGASRLQDACVKFLALCKKRKEAGLGLEDLELMAAESAQSDMAFIGAMGGTIIWHDHAEVKLPTGEDGNEKLSRRGSIEGTTGASPRSANGHGTMEDGDRGDYSESKGPSMVKGHPVMGAWQGQPTNQFMSGVYGQNPYLPYGFAGGPAGGPVPPGHPGLPYPHYPGSQYMPAPYPDVNGWQPHSPLPPQSHPLYQQTISTPPPSTQETPKLYGNPTHDSEEYSTEIAEKSMRPARRSASPRRRRSASPMRKVQIGRHGGSKRSGMVVIRNINYIASNEQQHENKGNGRSGPSDSWSEDGESEEEEEDSAGLVKSTTRDGNRRQSKREKKKALSKDAVLNGSTNPNVLSGDDTELNDRSQQKEGINNRDVNDQTAEDGLFFNLASRARQQSSYDPTLETVQRPNHGGCDRQEESGLAVDLVLLSQREGLSWAAQSQSFNMFEQEQQDSKKMSGLDDSYIIPDSRHSSITVRDTAISMEPDYDLSCKLDCEPSVDKRLSDDSFIVLDRSGETRNGNHVEWRMPLNLECEMPGDHSTDVVDSGEGQESFEPADLLMVADRSQDTHKRAWSSPLYYDMQVLEAEMMDNGQHGEEQAADDKDEVGEAEVAEKEDGNTESKPAPRKLSEKEAKAKAMKDMLERRRAAATGGRPGRPNPLAEAQLRAEKLRAYKADLQKSKKEKEEEERKRIEELRIQRQQRIAARSNSNGGPSSPAKQQDARTPPTAIKSSLKVPKKLSNGSPLSHSLNRDRTARVSPPALASLKSSESAVSRSLSSLSEQGKESRKSISVVKANTGSQLKVRSENGTIPHSDKNTITHGRSEEKVGRPTTGQTEEKVGHTNTGSAKEKIGRTAALTKEKLGRTKSERVDEELGHKEIGRADEKKGSSESGGTMEKVQALTSYAPKRVASQSVSTTPVKSTTGPVEGKPTKRSVVAAPLKTPVQKRTVPAESLAVPNKKSDTIALPTTQTEETEEDKKPSSLAKPVGHEELCHALQANENGYASPQPALISSSEEASHASLPNAMVMEEASHTSLPNATVMEEASYASLPTATVIGNEEPWREDACSSFQPESIFGSNNGQLERDIGSLVGEECHSPMAQISSTEDSTTTPAYAEIDPQEKNGEVLHEVPRSELSGEYSPPFAPHTEHALGPSTTLSPLSPHDLSPEPNQTESPSTRSRKKWGDSKAKGLKRLLLLGRKSSRSSAHSALDMPSEGEEEDSLSSNGKDTSLKPARELDSSVEQGSPAQTDTSFGSSSNKGSRSIFSLSTFRGKSTTVKV